MLAFEFSMIYPNPDLLKQYLYALLMIDEGMIAEQRSSSDCSRLDYVRMEPFEKAVIKIV
jgi:hypothetical protein